MSKLKKIMGTGAVITVLFAAPITVINQPTPALSQTLQVARGSTSPGVTAWQPYGDQSIFVDVDTTTGRFTYTPIYTTSLGGLGNHFSAIGATSIYNPTPTGFRVYVQWAGGGLLTPALANEYGWHINWIGVGDLPATVF